MRIPVFLYAWQPAAVLVGGLLLWALPAQAERVQGQVVRVWDGDSLHLLDRNGYRHKIRLADIDAPEIRQAWGTVCRQRLQARVLQQTVEAELLTTDRYGRAVARVWLAGEDVGLQQIAAGCAWHYRSVARQRRDAAQYAVYAEAENRARDQKLGLWQQRRAQAPWQFRRQGRQQSGEDD